MKQTAVEWLYERLERMIPRTALYNIDKEDYFKHAQEMEREQIIRARQDGLDNGFSNGSWDSNLYYNETFKSE